MKKLGITALKGVGIVAFAAYVVLDVFLYSMEVIPPNARIKVYPERQIWAPDSSFMDRDFERQLADPKTRDGALKWKAIEVSAIYADVKRGGKYEGYKTFPVLMEEPGRVTRGWSGSLLRRLLFNRPRWNADGTWNW